MDHPRFVCGLQRLRDLLGDRQRLIERDRPLGDPVGQGRPFDQLQDECLRVVGLLDAVDGRNAGVVQAGEDVGFPLKPGEAIGISREGVREDFQGDIAVELGVGGLIDLPHAPLADEGGHVVMAEAGAGAQGHDL